MSAEGSVLGAALVSLFAVWVLTPGAIRLAGRTGFLDHPHGHKSHAEPTAYLGGAAVICGFLIAAAPFADAFGRFAPMIACALALCALGTLDDRIGVAPRYRVLAEVAAAGVLTATGLGWEFLASDFERFLLTAAWIVGFTNAFNLMDNLDGAASTVGAFCACGIAVYAFGHGDEALAAMALGVTGACIGFLRYNLRPGGRARIFLGDGGALPLGFLIAAMATQVPYPGHLGGWPALLAAALMLGVLVLDTMLVATSRIRRRVSLTTGGRDHLTHRLLVKVGSPLGVAFTLAVLQVTVTTIAIAALEVGRTTVIATALTCFVLGCAIVALLDSPAWTRAFTRVESENRPDPGRATAT